MSSTPESAKAASTPDNTKSILQSGIVSSQTVGPIIGKGLIDQIEQEQKKNKKTT